MSGLLAFGLACIAAAIIGGGLKWSGIEIPVVGSIHRQVALGVLGIVIVAYSAHQLRAERSSQDPSVSFTISDFGVTSDLIESRTLVYLLGKKAAEIHMTKERPQSTGTVTVPRPGKYAYRIERTERGVARVYRDPEGKEYVGTQVYIKHWTGDGVIDVQTGVAYTLLGFFKYGATEPTLRLVPVGADKSDYLK